jgi:hypothetical protein
MTTSKEQKTIWVEDLRLQLIMPGKSKPITRAACDRLINKWQKGRIIIGKGQHARAHISEDIAEKVKEYFRLKHQH